MKLKNDNGLWIDEDTNTCVGYLFDFRSKGVYSPDGKVEITREQAITHNNLLSQGEIEGLDKNCQVGMHGSFYFIKNQVQTFMGVVVSSDVTVKGKSITFRRNGKTFRGSLRKDADLFNFKRIA
jgi:hypothetical protein